MNHGSHLVWVVICSRHVSLCGTVGFRRCPRKSASALDASEGTPQRLRHCPPLVSPDAVAKHWSSMKWETHRGAPPPAMSTFRGLPHVGSACAVRVASSGLGRGSTRSPEPADPEDNTQASIGEEKIPLEHALTHGTLCTAREVGRRFVFSRLPNTTHKPAVLHLVAARAAHGLCSRRDGSC